MAWYRRHARPLPWRNTRNPYYIWLSEIILQQTRVVQGQDYYLKFIETFPDVFALAKADEQQVLRLWQGLGYYTRARNLHYTAQYIATELNGKFPDTYQQLLQLRGVGKYTAAAIASFAFEEPVAVVDGNVYRVLARYFGEETDIASPKAYATFFALAQSLLPADQSATFNQAMMEFGAMQCVPVSPKCMFCPFQLECVAFATGRQAQLPVKQKKTKVRPRYFHYVVLRSEEGDVWLKPRTSNDIWKGLFDFYLVEGENEVVMESALLNDPLISSLRKEGTEESLSKQYVHILSHQKIYARFHTFVASGSLIERLVEKNAPGLRKIAADELTAYPLPVLIDKYLKETHF